MFTIKIDKVEKAIQTYLDDYTIVKYFHEFHASEKLRFNEWIFALL